MNIWLHLRGLVRLLFPPDLELEVCLQTLPCLYVSLQKDP